jgi:hypothetical protein
VGDFSSLPYSLLAHAAGCLLNPSNGILYFHQPAVFHQLHRLRGSSISMRRSVSCLLILSSHFQPRRAVAIFSHANPRLTSRTVRQRGLNTMAPIPAEPEEFEYIVIGGGSGGSGTVSLFLFSQPLWECSPLEIRVSADR